MIISLWRDSGHNHFGKFIFMRHSWHWWHTHGSFQWHAFCLENVCHVPCLTRNLISIPQLDDLGYKVTFSQSSWKINKGNILAAHGIKVGSLYPVYVSSKDTILSGPLSSHHHQFLCGIADWDTCLCGIAWLMLFRLYVLQAFHVWKTDTHVKEHFFWQRKTVVRACT